MQAHRYLLPILGLAFIAGCSDDSSGPSQTPTTMTITLDTLDFGMQVAAGLLVKDQHGATIDPSMLPASLTLESSDTTVATVDREALTLEGTGVGEAMITARYGDLEVSGTLPVRVGPKPAQLLVAGDIHNCLINSAGATVCWGSGEDGTLGDGNLGGSTEFDSGTPVTVVGDHSFTTLTAGYQSCALEDGAAWCWGDGGEGALGNGSEEDSAEPVEVSGGLTFAQISAGWGHVCALTSDGQAYCWGYNSDGEVGDGSFGEENVTDPVAVDTDERFAQIVASGDHTCALTRLGKTYCWGYGSDGALGTGDNDAQHTPVAVLDTLTLVSLSGGYYHECGLDRTGRAICWGENSGGELGNGTADDAAFTPTSVDATARFWMIGAATENHLCGIERDSNQLYCWGVDESGQIGDGGTVDVLSPTAVPGFQAKFVTAGEGHSCAVDVNDDVYCWGSNSRGQIGNGSVDGNDSDPILEPSIVNDLGGVAASRTARSVVAKSVQPGLARQHPAAPRHARRARR